MKWEGKFARATLRCLFERKITEKGKHPALLTGALSGTLELWIFSHHRFHSLWGGMSAFIIQFAEPLSSYHTIYFYLASSIIHCVALISHGSFTKAFPISPALFHRCYFSYYATSLAWLCDCSSTQQHFSVWIIPSSFFVEAKKKSDYVHESFSSLWISAEVLSKPFKH